ncbi:MAG TPA: STAS domain-containing protein [Acidimicrobiia bacterium]|nr:STAS domain-containing protein [Acidimicrobiia bacterium]
MKVSLHDLETTSHQLHCCGLVILNGNLDIASAAAVNAQVNYLHEQGMSHLLFDCAALEFVDTTGFRSLINAHQAFPGGIAVIAPQNGTSQLIKIMGVSKLLPDFDTVGLAQEHLHVEHEKVRPRLEE